MPRDQNSVVVKFGLSNADGLTLLGLYADPTTHLIKYLDAVGGSDFGGNHGISDDNSATSMIAASNADGTTPVSLYIDSATHSLLANST